MVNLSLEQLLQETTSDIALKREIIKEVIYRQSNLLAVGTKVLPVRNLDVLDVNFTYPSEMDGEYPVAEGSRAGFENIVWAPYGFTLKKGQVAFKMTDESIIRGVDQLQNRMSMTRATEAMVKKQDAEIMAAIIAGATQTVAIGVGDEWDTAAGDPESDIVDARQAIMDHSNISSAEIRNLALLVGTNISGVLLKQMMINNVVTRLSDYLQASFGITMYETRDAHLIDTAILMVIGEQTGIHGVYTGGAVPLVEETRLAGVGTEYLVTKYFKSKIAPDSSTIATSSRICTITNTHS